MEDKYVEELHLQPRSSAELQDAVRRFDMKWHRKKDARRLR